MYKPKDFLPAKYGSKATTKPTVSSPWNDLAKTPKIPDYERPTEMSPDHKLTELKAIDQQHQQTKTAPSAEAVTSKASLGKKPTLINHKLAGLLMVFFLVIGVFASYMLSKQNQDNRQQAFVACDTTDPYCEGGKCEDGYYLLDSICVPGVAPNPNDNCGENRHLVAGQCVHESCHQIANGNIVCGYPSDDDPCTEESMGGNWCDNPNTTQTETCEEAGLMRCQCAPSWWVIGKAESCDILCSDAKIECPSCPPVEDDEPSDNPSPTQKLACGQYGCTRNADCNNGLTCQTVEVDGRNRKICAKGENQLFCAAAPSVKNCCESQPMPVCASIEMLNANNEVMQGNDDAALKLNDRVRFRCSASGNQDVEFDYQFRIWDTVTATWTDITDLTDTVAKNISALYTIKNFGKHIAQGRICWGNSCQPWESPETTPTQACQDDEDCPSGSTCYQPPMPACPSGTSCPQVMPAKYCKEETDNNTTARCQSNADCQNGYTCSSTPAGGCPLVTVNGVKVPSNCASAPICRQAEGISCTNTTDCFMGYSCQNRQCKRQAGACQSDADCQNGYTCYQPTTAEIANCSGANCAQVASYCKEKTVSCQSDADCKEGYLCSAEVSGSSGNASYTSISTNKICQKIEGMTCQNSSACGTGYACYSGHCTQTIKTCQNNDECGTGYACCASSMPACPPGVSCPQVMPAKNCVLSKYCVNR